MKSIDIPCMNDEQVIIGSKLCSAVKFHPCLYDPVSPGYEMRNAVAAAWKVVAKECDDTAANCRFRWKAIRSSFSRSFRKSGVNSQYYLYEYLDFLLPCMSLGDKNEESTGQVEDIDLTLTESEEVVSVASDIVYNDSDTTKSAEETGGKSSSPSNKTTEAEHEFVSLRPNQTERPTPLLEENREGRPSRTRRLPKRRYEPEPIAEIPMEKRPRRILERRKSVGGLVLREFMQKHNLAIDTSEVEIPQPMIDTTIDNPIDITPINLEIKTKLRILKETADAGIVAKPLTRENSTLTETTWTSDEKAMQCSKCSKDAAEPLDDEFLETLRPQIKIMNFRQKINFKQRVYLALMDVLDDVKNFPNEGDVVELPPPLAKHFETATSGELRLMRELVSLVQAAKMSSEIVNANKNVTVVRTTSSPSTNTSPPPQNIDDLIEIVEETGGSKDSGASSNSNSPNNLINVKSTDSLGIPRHILQRAVQVTGNSGGTLLAQNGDKRRVYRIFPKNGVVSPQTFAEKVVTQGTPIPTSTPSTIAGTGTFYVTPPKTITKTITIPNSSFISPPVKPLPPSLRAAIQYPKIIKTPTITSTPTPTTSSPMLPPNMTKSPVSINGHSSNTPTGPPPKIHISSQAASASIYRRRYSICGPAPTGSSPLLQQRLGQANAVKTFTPPPPLSSLQQQAKLQSQDTQPKMLLQQQLKMKQQQQLKMQQQLQQHQSRAPQQHIPISQMQQKGQQQQRIEKPVSQLKIAPPTTTTNPTNIQISKAISLMSQSQTANGPKLVPGSESTITTTTKSSNGVLEGSPDVYSDTTNDIPVLETAGTIAADSFDPEFSKPYIKLEPEEE